MPVHDHADESRPRREQRPRWSALCRQKARDLLRQLILAASTNSPEASVADPART